jgi:hypothetical protein
LYVLYEQQRSGVILNRAFHSDRGKTGSMGPVDVVSTRLALVTLIQAACQLFENPPLDPSLERLFHPYLRVVRNIERCGLVRVSSWIGFSAIGSRMVTSRRLA